MKNIEKNKEVDIRTPVGSLKMSNKTGEIDFGMKVYPGARVRHDSETDHHDDNVNLNVVSSLIGIKLVSQKYDSDDSVAEVQSFYERELSQFGPVSKSLCTAREGEEYDIELKTGEEYDQHIVAIKSRGSGSSLAMVHIQVHCSR